MEGGSEGGGRGGVPQETPALSLSLGAGFVLNGTIAVLSIFVSVFFFGSFVVFFFSCVPASLCCDWADKLTTMVSHAALLLWCSRGEVGKEE